MSDPVSDLKHELLAATERQQGHAPVNTDRRRRGRPGRSRLLLAAATVAIAAAVALLVTAPWDNSPSILAKAQAAITPPPGSVLHMKWEDTDSPTNPQCTVTRGPNEIWIDQTEPHRYRALFLGLDPYQPGDPRAHVCSKSTPYEFGGTLTFGARAEWALRFVPPNRLWFQTDTFNFPWTPLQIFAGRSAQGTRTMKAKRDSMGAQSNGSASLTCPVRIPPPPPVRTWPTSTSTPRPLPRSNWTGSTQSRHTVSPRSGTAASRAS